MRTGAWLARLAVVLAAGGFAPLAARWWWGIELVSHFRVQYLFVAVPLMIAAVVFGRRMPALLLAAAIGLNAWPLLPYAPWSREPQQGLRFDVLNVNVNAGNRNHAAIAAAITAARPDLAVIVELTPAVDAALRALEHDFPYRLSVPDRHNFGIGMLSRHRLSHTEVLALSGTAAIDARVELPYGALRFIGVHLAPPTSRELAAKRNRQLEELADVVGRIEEPLVVCGDFNLTPYSPFFAQFTRATGLSDTRLGQGIGFSWPTSLPGFRIPIDHCLVRGPIAAESVERMDRIGSDHYPVRVRLLWQATQ